MYLAGHYRCYVYVYIYVYSVNVHVYAAAPMFLFLPLPQSVPCFSRTRLILSLSLSHSLTLTLTLTLTHSHTLTHTLSRFVRGLGVLFQEALTGYKATAKKAQEIKIVSIRASVSVLEDRSRLDPHAPVVLVQSLSRSDSLK